MTEEINYIQKRIDSINNNIESTKYRMNLPRTSRGMYSQYEGSIFKFEHELELLNNIIIKIK